MGNNSNSQDNICKIMENNKCEENENQFCVKFKRPTSNTTNDLQVATTGDSSLENAEVNVSWKYS